MTINSWTGRLSIAFVVFLCVSFIIVPHIADVNPPLLVKVLLWPMYLVGPAIGRMLPHGNIGTTEHPIYEATPIDALVGMALVGLSIIFYPVATLVVLSLVSRIQARKRSTQE